MGNSAANSSARVDVCLEKSQYTAGETLRGYVQVNVTAPMTCSNVFAILKAEVRTTVHYDHTHHEERDGKTHTRTERRTAHGHEVVVEDKRLVARFPSGGANPGLYQFPFSFELHPSLPSSANVPGHDHAQLSYGIEVQLERPGMFKWDLVQRTFFDLVATVPHAIVGTRKADEQHVHCCCCISRGSMELAAHLERNAFCANEAVRAIVELNNRSSLAADTVTVSLMESISLRAHGHSATRSSCLASVTLPSVGPGQTLPSAQVLLQLPPQFNHCSVRTSLLQITHHVQITATTPCCNGNPSLTLPVTLYRSAMLMAFQAPPAVQEHETVHFVQALPYSPDSAAMHSPEALPIIQAEAVVPTTAQALQTAPFQQAMPSSPQYPQDAAVAYPQGPGGVYPQGPAGAYPQSSSAAYPLVQ